MSKEQDYTSETDESDADFHPDDLAGESPVSEEEEADSDSEVPEENDNDADQISTKRKKSTLKVIKKRRTKSTNKQEGYNNDKNVTEYVDINTPRRSTRQAENIQIVKEKTKEKDELLSDEEDKTRTNSLWADFLKDVNPTASSSKQNVASTSRLQEKALVSPSNGKSVINSNDNTKEKGRETIVKSKDEGNKKNTVIEVLDFAGEEVHIEREVDASSIKENKAAATQSVKKQPFGRIMPGVSIKRNITATGTVSAGIGSIINQLGKKKKLSVLEKSQLDWNNFKQSEGIDEQLQTFNKGKDGYLERQDFLQRTDLRQFEIEKNLRQTTRRPL